MTLAYGTRAKVPRTGHAAPARRVVVRVVDRINREIVIPFDDYCVVAPPGVPLRARSL
jgi:hypothetical protein